MLRQLLAAGFLGAWVTASVAAGPAEKSDALEDAFACPPASARPWVYWFWLDGNITREGITADLEAMQRVGIGGVLIMEVDQGAPQGPTRFGSPPWRELFSFVCAEAHRLGLEVSMNNDAGWCGSGGPGITPELAMQKLTASETCTQGPQRFSGALAQPPAVKDFYRDIAVLALPTPTGDDVIVADASPRASASVSGKDLRPQNLLDGNPQTTFTLPRPEPKEPQWVQVEFPRPFTVRSLTLSLVGNPRFGIHGALQVSDDGREFRAVREFDGQPPMVVLNVPETTARWFRVEFTRALHPRLEKLKISDLQLSPGFRIENIAAKADFIAAQFTAARSLPSLAAWPTLPPSLTIARERIVDLTAQMGPDGKLAWDVPAGKWTILRIGHTLTGKDNHPAPQEGRGLECDKCSRAAARAAFEGLLGRLIAENRALTGPAKTLVATHIDSWEVGSQNWTPRMREEFQRLRGYDLWKFLPVITGRVVESVEVSERFLWDLRQTVSDLVRENYAGELRRLANQHGLRLSIEAYFGCPCDEIAYGGEADEPMAEFWSWGKFGAAYSCTEMASAAHVYGKRIVGAEAFTASDKEKWQSHPGNIKDLGDWAFCEGINRLVFHRYALQPWAQRKPGMSMGPWGLHYERGQTWWEQSRPWHEYLARCQHLLRQGLFVADVCYVQPEGVPRRFAPPESASPKGYYRPGYNFDGCTPEVVLTRMSVKDGRIVLPDGMSYRVLVLPEVETMTPALLGRVAELVRAGATVVAPSRPQKSPSLSGYPQCDAEVQKVAAALWAGGKLVTGKTAEQVLAELGVPEDFHSERPLRYIHRRLEGADVYFVANGEPRAVETPCMFRVAGKRPELWHPETGRITPLPAYEERKGCTRLPLYLGPHESVFVVFRRTARSDQRVVSVTRDGQEILSTAISHGGERAPASGSFTMLAWVQPEADTPLPAESNHGIAAHGEGRNDLIYPPPGHEVWTAADAGAGLAVGRNGVCVLEHGAGYFAAPLVFAAPLSTWTHLAVVYRDNRPSLYLDGKLVRTGLPSPRKVHGGVDVTHARRIAPFRGQVLGLQQFARPLDDAEIARLAQRPRPAPAAGDRPALDLVAGKVWQPGTYAIHTADGRRRQLAVDDLPAPQPMAGPWEVSFDPQWGGPEQPVRFDQLEDWSQRSAPGIRYYSGTATYRKTFELPGSALRPPHRAVFLDLGNVQVIAEVKLNGRQLGTLWKPPFCLEITDALHPGANALEVRVVNLWVNRLIGDEQLPEDSQREPKGTLKSWPPWLERGQPSPTGRYTFTSWRLWHKDDPLAESGLLGPVVLRFARTIPAEGP